MYFAHGVLGDAGNDIAEIGFGVDGVEPCGFDDCVHAPTIRQCRILRKQLAYIDK